MVEFFSMLVICVQLEGQERAEGWVAYDTELQSVTQQDTITGFCFWCLVHCIIHNNSNEGKHSLRAHECQVAGWSLVMKKGRPGLVSILNELSVVGYASAEFFLR